MNAKGRALRVLFVANDGLSAGHVARTLAVARGISRRAAAREIDARMILATTSEADSLLAKEALVVVRLPAPVSARRAGFSDQERRRIVRGALDGVIESFAPDLIVVDTFPSGPHGELAGAGVSRAKKALIRRSIPDERAGDETLTAGLLDYDLALLASDPFPIETRLPIPTVNVPCITMIEARDGESREKARAALGLPADGRALLVAAGGGGDEEAARRALSIAESVTRLEPETTVALALGPLASVSPSEQRAVTHPGGVRVVRAAPLQPLLAAFDGAIAPAGYNTAHELAKAGVPSALFSQQRPFDDQAARAQRFAKASIAIAIDAFDDATLRAALSWMRTAPRPSLEAGGADRAADALLDLATGEAAPRR